MQLHKEPLPEQQLHLMACAFHHRDRDHPPKQHSCVQPLYLSVEGAVKERWLQTGAAWTLSFVSSPSLGTSLAVRRLEVACHSTTPVHSWRIEDDKKASLMPHPTQRLHPRPHWVIPALKVTARLWGAGCCLGRCLQGGYELPYSVAALMGGLCVCALVFGCLQAFCGLSLLSKRHLLEAPKNTKGIFLAAEPQR